MSVARLLDRRDTAEAALYSTFGSFNRLKVSEDGLAYTSNIGEVQLGQVYGSSGASEYIPAILRGVDAQLDANQTYAGRISFVPQYNNTLKELCWIGSDDINTTLKPDSWGLFVRALGAPNLLEGQIGLTQKDPSATPPVLTGLTYLWSLVYESGGNDFIHAAVDDRGVGTNVVLETIAPIGATPATEYSRDVETYTSFLKNSGVATIQTGSNLVIVSVPNLSANGIALLTWADNAVVEEKLWAICGSPVNTLKIQTTANVLADTNVNWFIAQF